MTETQFTTEELNSEQWKTISGFTKYQVSTLGRIRRTEACKGRPAGYILSQRISGMGYQMVCLQSDLKKEAHRCVHRLVADTFLDVPRSGQTQVNHRDGVKVNNRLSNLEHVSPKENTRHSIEVLGNDHSGENHGMVKLTAAHVIEIHNLRMQGVAANHIAKQYAVEKITVLRIIHRRAWKKVLANYPTNYPPSIHYGKRGSNSHSATITDETARQIKSALKLSAQRGDDQKIASQFGVPLQIVRNIKYGNSWKHIE